MTRPKKSSSKSGRARRPAGASQSFVRRNLRRIGLLVLLAGLVGLVVAVAYLVVLDQRVSARFEGRRWELPARVYARPLELYTGLNLTAAQLEGEIAALDYRRPFHPARPGTWTAGQGVYRISTRAFEFWDGAEVSLPVEVTLVDNTVHSLRHAVNGQNLALVRLDPSLIASIYPSHQEDRILIRARDLPAPFVAGLIAVEDRRFHSHHGIDVRGLARAMWINLKAGRWVQGGSTLTQQLVKNFFLTPDRSLWRKGNEAFMALILEQRYSKEEILETYLNEIYMGQNGRRSIHGIGLASRFYFGREAAELTLAQQALLIGLIRGPSHYNPRQHPERASELRNLILQTWHTLGVIDEAAFSAARREPLGVTKVIPEGQTRYPAFLDLVRRQLREDYREEDLRSAGLRIFTTLAPGIQALAEQSVARRIGAFKQPELQGAFVVARPGSGEVIALGGGREPAFAGFNRALDARRPIGSLLKPLIYLEALAKPERYTLVSTLDDSPLSVPDPHSGVWEPQNFDRTFHGEVTLLDALSRSLNVASVRLGMDVGVETVVQRMQTMGVDRPVSLLPSVLLGAVDLSPLEVAQIYQILAAGGFRMPLRAIREVQDAQAQPLTRYPIKVEQVADPEAVYLVDYALQNVVRSGTARALYDILPGAVGIAGKTGTTNDYRDSWFAGYVGDTLGVVWLGRDDNQPIGLTGSSGALRVWGEMLRGLPVQSWAKAVPEAVEWVWIDLPSRTPTEELCPGAIQLPFVAGSTPPGRIDCPGAQFKRTADGVWDWFKGQLE